jgi:hypothetical protein
VEKADNRPSAVTLRARELLDRGRSVVEVSSRTGLPPALVELIAGELNHGSTPSGGTVSGGTVSGPAGRGPGAPGPRTVGGGRREQQTRITITMALAVLGMGGLLASLASTMLHSTVIGILGACCVVGSLLAVLLFTRRTR